MFSEIQLTASIIITSISVFARCRLHAAQQKGAWEVLRDDDGGDGDDNDVEFHFF